MTSASSPSAETSTASRRKKEPPERKIGPFANGVGICIWQNQTQTEQGPRTFRTITINPRRYFDRESNQWKDSPSFNPADLPALIYSLQLAAQYCYESNPTDGDSSDGAANGGEEVPF